MYDVDKKAFINFAATTSAFDLRGGHYGFTIKATWGGGTVKIQRLAADGSSYVDVKSYTADGYDALSLPIGTYKLAVTTATEIYADLTSVVTSLG